MNEQDSKKLFWYRIKLLALITVFLSPFIGGWLALYVFEIRPESGNYGELISPVKKLDWPVMVTSNGERLESGFGRKWAFLLFNREKCAEDCRANLYYMRQIRVLLGRNSGRLQNVFITARALDEDMKEFLAEYPDLVVIDNYLEQDLYRQFQLPQHEAVGSSPKLYLVDPDSNLMMHYPAQNDQNRVLDDLRKLMKLSQIG